MKKQNVESEQVGWERELVGVTAKTKPYLMAKGRGRRRIKGMEARESNAYHVMSRTCGGTVFLDDIEKEALRRLLWRQAELLGVRLLTYCVMGNHFHALVEVPRQAEWLQRFEGLEGEARLLSHLRVGYSAAWVEALRAELAELRRRGLGNLAEAKLAALKRRFCDLSIYVKEVKERFSRWYNKRHGRKGTLWMDRFKSVLVEARGERQERVDELRGVNRLDALRAMALYIDLNPVRAGLVEEPGDYAWSGYGEAVRGKRRAQRGLARVVGHGVDRWESAGVHATYSRWLDESIKHALRIAAERKQLEQGQLGVESDESRESEGWNLLERVGVFSEGLAVGTTGFVGEMKQRYYELTGRKRTHRSVGLC